MCTNILLIILWNAIETKVFRIISIVGLKRPHLSFVELKYWQGYTQFQRESQARSHVTSQSNQWIKMVDLEDLPNSKWQVFWFCTDTDIKDRCILLDLVIWFSSTNTTNTSRTSKASLSFPEKSYKKILSLPLHMYSYRMDKLNSPFLFK